MIKEKISTPNFLVNGIKIYNEDFDKIIILISKNLYLLNFSLVLSYHNNKFNLKTYKIILLN